VSEKNMNIFLEKTKDRNVTNPGPFHLQFILSMLCYAMLLLPHNPVNKNKDIEGVREIIEVKQYNRRGE
jgi:hypothetical protein